MTDSVVVEDGSAPSPAGTDADAGTSSRPASPDLSSAPAWVGGLTVVALAVVWTQVGAGYDVTAWMPGALLVAALVVVAVTMGGGAVALTWRQLVALFALLGFAGWSFLSIAWADVPGDAWVGANRTLLYASVFAFVLILPWTPRAAVVTAWAYCGGVTAVAAYAIYRVTTTSDDSLFIDGRFAYPTEYPNANVAVFITAFWIALAVATRREQPVVVRALALGAVAFLPQAALIVQSRAAVVAVPLAAMVVVAVGPERLRTILGLGVAAIPVVAGWNVHLRVYERAEDGGSFLESAMQPSSRFMLVSSVLAIVLGSAWALLDRRYVPSPRATRAAGAVAAVGAAVVLLVGAAAVARSDPGERVRTAWDELTTNETDYEGSSRYGSLDSQRWDHWRVGLGRFQDSPLVGIGAEQFAVDYLRERRTAVDARYVHSFGIGVLSQLGLVGALLFATFAVVATLGVWPRASQDPLARTFLLGAFGAWVYWLIHSSVDWFYELPAVTTPIFALLAIGAVLTMSQRVSGASASTRSRGRRAGLVAVTCVLGAAALVSLAAPYAAAREQARALEVWQANPQRAFDLLERARALNPLSDEPDMYAGLIAARLEDRQLMRRYFGAALERNPHNWYAHLELGLTYSLDGRAQDARREVRRALALNPSEPILVDVLDQLEAGEVVSPRAVAQLFIERIQNRLT